MPGFKISPQSVTIGVGQTQQFEALDEKGQIVNAQWSVLSPERWAGRIMSETGLYIAPSWIFLGRKVVIVAKAGEKTATAEVELSPALFWIRFVGAYLLLCFVGLVWMLAFRWEHFCPTCKPDLVRVSPPVVTLLPSQSQLFTANVPVHWMKDAQDLGQYLYPAPQTLPAGGKETVIATTSDRPSKSGAAEVFVSPAGGLTIEPTRATILAGGSVELTAIPSPAPTPAPAPAPVPTPAPTPAPTPKVDKVEWLSPELGTLTPSSDGTTTRFSVAGKIERPVTLMVLARIAGATPRIAGSWVTVLPPSSPLGTTVEACGTDAESLLRLIALMGALGGIIHGISSFTTFVGNREFVVSWVWWYVFKPFLSALVALVVFLVFRGGFSSNDYALAAADCLKVAAFAGLIGLFAEPATLKLRDIFETLFTPRNDPRRDAAGQVKPSGPQLDSLSPTTLTVDQTNLPVLTLNGSGFAKDCQVKVGDKLRKTTKWTTTQLTVPLLQDDVAKPGKLEVVVYNKPPDGEPSNAKEITVEAGSDLGPASIRRP